MITPEEAREIADKAREEQKNLKNWNFLDELQYKSIERRIKYWSKKGGKFFFSECVRTRVAEKLKSEHYKVRYVSLFTDRISWEE